MKNLLLLLMAVVLFACGETNTTADATDAPMDMEEANDQATQAMTDNSGAMDLLSTTVAAVRDAGGDITALSPEAAQSNINGWIGQLDGVEGAEPIVEDLANLKKEFMLGSDEGIDGPSVAKIMNRLANNTRKLSGKAPGLGMLADALDKGAEKLVSY